MPLSPQEQYAIQQQYGAQAAAQGQQGAQQQSDLAMQQYYQQLAQQQMAFQYAQWQAQQAQQKAAVEQTQASQDRADKLSAEYQKKIDEANQKNESRYLDILAGRTDTKNRVLGDLKDYGQSQINDATDRNNALKSQMNANIYSRGFGGSPSMLNSAGRSASTALTRDLRGIQDDIINRRVNTDSSQSNGIYDFMERRNDVPPDLNQLISLQQGLGRSGPYLNQPSYANGAQQGNLFGGGMGQSPYNPGGFQAPMPGGMPGMNPFQLQPLGGGNINRNYQPNRGGASPYSLPGMGGVSPFISESLPGGGTGSPLAQLNNGPTPYNPIPTHQQQAANQQQLAMRNAQLGVKMSSYNTMGSPANFDNQQFAQNQAIAGGQANYAPGQPAPVIPGMAGGPIGIGGQLPSLNYYNPGNGYGGYKAMPGQQPTGGGNYGPNYRTRMAGYGAQRQQAVAGAMDRGWAAASGMSFLPIPFGTATS